MKAIVRDDIIKLESFIAARFKYEKYISKIYESGGYCFIDQFDYHYGTNEGRYIVKQLIESGLVKTKAFSSYKFCYLTDTSIKYLKFKDSEEDFSHLSKDKINVKKITRTPSDKVLFSSALKFAFLHKEELVGKSQFEKHLQEILSKIYNKNSVDKSSIEYEVKKLKEDYQKYYEVNKNILENHLKPLFKLYKGENIVNEHKEVSDKVAELENLMLNQKRGLFNRATEIETELQEYQNKLNELSVYKLFLENINNQVAELKNELRLKDQEYKTKKELYNKIVAELDVINEKTKVSVKKAIDYYDKSKLIFIPYVDKLLMIILDAGALKNVYGYMKVLKDFINLTELQELPIEILILSYSKIRAENLLEEFITLKKQRNAAKEKVEEFEAIKKSKGYKYEPDYYKISKSTVENILDFEVKCDDTAYYMENYKKNLGLMTEYIKPKDKDRFEELKKALKEREDKE